MGWRIGFLTRETKEPHPLRVCSFLEFRQPHQHPGGSHFKRIWLELRNRLFPHLHSALGLPRRRPTPPKAKNNQKIEHAVDTLEKVSPNNLAPR